MTADVGIINSLETLSYLGIFIWLMFYNIFIVIPLPEEIVLLSIGFVSSIGYLNPWMGGIIAILAFLISDSVFYYLALTGNSLVKKVVSRFGEKTLIKYEARMQKNIPKTLTIITFIPKARFFGPVIMGSLKIKWKRFLMFDALALFVYSVFYISLGYFFHATFKSIADKLSIFQHFILDMSMLTIIIIIIYILSGYILKKFK